MGSTIMKCVTSVSYSAIVNGKTEEVFKPTRGIRQGDILSPFRFLDSNDGLSTLMRFAIRDGLIRGAKVNRSGP